MNELNAQPVEPDLRAIELAKMLGARQALGMIAGRCSAADAELLRNVRDEKKYLNLSASWDEFCQKHLHISKRHADRTIQLLKEFGPGYFELSQLTRISPREFRAIAAHVDNGSIRINGEAIALIEANSDKVAAAVSELREKKSPECGSQSHAQRLAEIERRCERLSQDLGRLRDQGVNTRDLAETIYRIIVVFDKLHLTLFEFEPEG
jgi:hypothetical protein